ncbi:hypothetical protein ABKN59_004412 [Abortiporus biennis]
MCTTTTQCNIALYPTNDVSTPSILCCSSLSRPSPRGIRQRPRRRQLQDTHSQVTSNGCPVFRNIHPSALDAASDLDLFTVFAQFIILDGLIPIPIII